MEEAQHADRVLIMNDGKITGDGTPEEIFSKIELLKEAGLSIPQTTELLEILRRNGVDIKRGIISVEDCADEIAKIIKQ